mmetsp:Transcript_24200/g.42539  ORF Transcript_24200/g.42539 Transcript_24200/m.42539 type:complete len:343 (-) Transcript_24200:73-1101(-)
MTRLLRTWRVVAAVAFLLHSPSFSLDSINMELEVLEEIDLSALGTPNLDRYKGFYTLNVDETTCEYELKFTFTKHPEDVPGEPMFQGNCAPEDNTGVASDGIPWHQPRRHWLEFEPEVYETTGFNHMSLYWVPCGHEPGAFKQARYDINLYTVIPQYRAYMVCQEFKTPAVCQYNQSSFIGRGMFSIPRMVNDPNFLPNLPARFQPDRQFPEAFQYEGLTHYDVTKVPEAVDDWVLPTHLMKTYDGDVVSWNYMIPFAYISGPSSIAEANQIYTYQTMMQLPYQFNMTYTAPTGVVETYFYGTAANCEATTEVVEDAIDQEEDIVFEDPNGNSTGPINRLRG